MRLPWKAARGEKPWPIVLRDRSAEPSIVLRPLTPADETAWHRVRRDNVEHVRPWEPTIPPGSDPVAPVTFRQFVQDFDRQARSGQAFPWCLEVHGAIAGQVHLFGVVAGANQSACAGYWVARSVARLGVASRAVALAIDHALGPGGLHRIEVNIRVDNVASLGVVRRLGLRDEGIRERYLHIDGAWRDHRSFAVTREEIGPEGLLGRLSHQ